MQSGLLESPAESLSVTAEATPTDSREVSKLKSDNEELNAQIKAAAGTIQELRTANSRLHAFIVEDQ